jgi:DNA-binding Xre family transcriptional regulator
MFHRRLSFIAAPLPTSPTFILRTFRQTFRLGRVPKRKRSLGGDDPRVDRDPERNEPLPKVSVGLLLPPDPSTDTALSDAKLLAQLRLRSRPNDGKPKQAGTFARFGADVGHVDAGRAAHGPVAGCYDVTTLSSPKAQSGVTVSDTNGEVAKQRVPEYEDIVRRVGKRLNTRRDEAGLSLRDLERLTGISVATISRIENGLQREMSAGTFFKLCETLALDPLVAWYGETRRPAQKTASGEFQSSRPPVPKRRGE